MLEEISRVMKFTERVRKKNIDTGNVSIKIAQAKKIRPTDTVIIEAVDSYGNILGTRTYTGTEFHLALRAKFKMVHGRRIDFYLIAY